MYSSHDVCFKNSKNFLCADVWKGVPKNTDPRYKGRQFQTRPLLKGQVVGSFDKFTYSTDNYQDRTMYLNSQPLADRKTGFGSHDARRRDEFSSDIRARQWREKLEGEKIYAQSALKAAGMTTGNQGPPPTEAQMLAKRQKDFTDKYAYNPGLFQTQVPWNLYDIGRNEEGAGITPICNKCPRERFYCPHRVGRGEVTLRRPGTAPTSAKAYGDFVTSAEKPKFGVVSEHKSFYDNSHLTRSWSS